MLILAIVSIHNSFVLRIGEYYHLTFHNSKQNIRTILKTASMNPLMAM